jgi:hypothetical protein
MARTQVNVQKPIKKKKQEQAHFQLIQKALLVGPAPYPSTALAGDKKENKPAEPHRLKQRQRREHE